MLHRKIKRLEMFIFIPDSSLLTLGERRVKSNSGYMYALFKGITGLIVHWNLEQNISSKWEQRWWQDICKMETSEKQRLPQGGREGVYSLFTSGRPRSMLTINWGCNLKKNVIAARVSESLYILFTSRKLCYPLTFSFCEQTIVTSRATTNMCQEKGTPYRKCTARKPHHLFSRKNRTLPW